MNDKYLFKAKRIDNEEWVQGYYVNCLHPTSDIGTGHFIVVYPGDYYIIYTSTLCQCTGLKDKNGKLIWENAVVIYGDFVGVVKFGHCNCNGTKNIGFYIDWSNAYYYRQDLGWWLDKISVIGSSIDNPELLEVE